MRKKALVVPRFAINTVLKHRNHGLVCLLVKMVNLVPPIQGICHDVWRWRIGYGR
jgi:hypothetical protein